MLLVQLRREYFGPRSFARQSKRESGGVFDLPPVERFQRGLAFLSGVVAVAVTRIPHRLRCLENGSPFLEPGATHHFDRSPGITFGLFEAALTRRFQSLDMP